MSLTVRQAQCCTHSEDWILREKKDRHIPRVRPKQSKALSATVGQTDPPFRLPNGLFR